MSDARETAQQADRSQRAPSSGRGAVLDVARRPAWRAASVVLDSQHLHPSGTRSRVDPSDRHSPEGSTGNVAPRSLGEEEAM